MQDVLPSDSVRQSGNNFCWLTGMVGPPEWWCAPWWLHVAHIASGTAKAVRVNDRRAVVLLSPLAHQAHVSVGSSTMSVNLYGREFPTITERHTLFLKQTFDPEYYDERFLQSIWIGRLPSPEMPPPFWRELLFNNIGAVI